MTELFIYALVGLALVLLGVLSRVSEPKRHNWHEVDSAHLAMLARRKRKR